MSTPIRVDFHCHSSLSDGALAPEALADLLANAGMAHAALADHDTLDGLEPFRKRLASRGVGFLTGVEITVQWRGREAHLLAYGFDPDHAELRATLAAIRQSREPGVDSIAGSVRKNRLSLTRASAPTAAGADGRLAIKDAIDLIHQAGGSAFLAHPLLGEPDCDSLEALLPDLKAAGLDGIEALYPAFSPEDQERLCAMARRRGLLVSAGSDFHNSMGTAGDKPGVEMPRELWKAFRDAIFSGARRPAKKTDDERFSPHRPRRVRFIFRIVLPTVIAMLLFAVALLDIILPAIERSLLERKREMIRELVNSAWGILAEADQEVQAGLTPRETAQKMAKKRIETMRYGREGKDYFWLQDMHPHILMHPYRPELNGQDVSDFRDARGIRIFVEFTDLVRRQNEGFIDYVWQWKDDPHRLVPKESYIRGFAPWGWIIGTGMYTEDVRAETARFERHLMRLSLGIAGLIALLLLYVIRQSLLLERRRRESEGSLRETTERYLALVEAATEGTLLLVEGRCRYANPTLLRLLGYAANEIELLDLADILPPQPYNERAWEAVRLLQPGQERSAGIEAVLKARDGKLLECLLILSRISVAGKDGLVLQARDLTPRRTPGPESPAVQSERDKLLAEAAGNVPAGLFRARAIQRASVLEANRTAVELLPALGVPPNGTPPALAAVFPDAMAFADFHLRLEREGLARERLHTAGPDGRIRTLNLNARLVRDENGAPRYIDGLVEDATAEALREAEREALIERLQTALLNPPGSKDRSRTPSAPAMDDAPESETSELVRKIAGSAGAEEAIHWCRRAPSLARALLESGAPPREITRMATAVCDAATRRFLALAEAQQGPAPCPFAFLALGSQGRQEMTLCADQDNALLYEPGPDSTPAEALNRYFLDLGRQVCAWLDRAGYPFCRGGIVARNPKWCGPLSAWRSAVTNWIHLPEPQQVLEFAIFLDFRTVYGKEELALSLRRHVHETLRANPAFLPFLARDLLRFEPPSTGLGRLLRPWKAEANLLDLKAVLMPLSGMARLYALRSELAETHTLDRLEALARSEVITKGYRRETAAAYEVLLRLRLNHQAECLREGQSPDNTIDWRRLSRREQSELSQVFDRVALAQKKIGYDFLGGT
jgi:PAS domain S-box-containing protein